MFCAVLEKGTPCWRVASVPVSARCPFENQVLWSSSPQQKFSSRLTLLTLVVKLGRLLFFSWRCLLAVRDVESADAPGVASSAADFRDRACFVVSLL